MKNGKEVYADVFEQQIWQIGPSPRLETAEEQSTYLRKINLVNKGSFMEFCHLDDELEDIHATVVVHSGGVPSRSHKGI